MIDLQKLFIDVFDPQAGEMAMVLFDTPHSHLQDTPAWASRRAMAERWHAELARLGERRGFRVLPLVSFPATGAHNAQLPEQGNMNGEPVRLDELPGQATLVLALTQFSASAPLVGWTQRSARLRIASMPLIEPAMEQTALAADYSQVARSCARLQSSLADAKIARIGFSNGDALTIDLRFRAAHADDGQLHADKKPPRIINLPGGEAYKAAYEGERAGTPSDTHGVLPVVWRGGLAAPKHVDHAIMFDL
jgi:hypothetical protein